MAGRKDFQVVIAGAGPAGTLLARDLAAAGIPVAVYDTRKEGELGHNWSDAVEKSALAAAGFDLPAIEDGRYKGPLVKTAETDDNLFEPHVMKHLQIRSPDLSCTTRSDVDFGYITTDRKALGRTLAEQAVAAGARIFYRHRAEKLIGDTEVILDKVDVQGMRVTDLDSGESFYVAADLVVDATGYTSGLRTGLVGAPAINAPFEGSDLAYACRTVRQLDMGRAAADDLTDHYRYGAYKGYFWTHLHHGDVVDVGGGVPEAPDRIDPKTVIEEMIAQRPSITGTEIRGGGGIVLVGRSPGTLVASGFIAVGDAAGQVIPTTGCGVGGAMDGARMAAEAIMAALEKGSCTLSALWPYNSQWFSGRGSHLAALSALKAILQDLTHEEITFLMKQDILSGEMLTPSINGTFEPPGLLTTLRTLKNGITRPGLLLKLNKATSLGGKIFKHYRKYPQKWNSRAFYEWYDETAKLFGGIS